MAGTENRDVSAEPDRVSAGLVVRFAVLLGVVSAATLVGVWGFFHFLESRTRAAEARPSPVEAEQPLTAEQKLPPEPRLAIDPLAALAQLRAAEDERLTTYGWVDKPAGVVRIPISRAMELMVERETQK